MAFTKGLYAKESRGLPKLYVPLQDIGKFTSIYCKCKVGVPLIWDEIKNIYMENGFTELEAAKYGKEVWQVFWNACYNLNAKQQFPFVLKLQNLNLNLMKDKDEN